MFEEGGVTRSSSYYSLSTSVEDDPDTMIVRKKKRAEKELKTVLVKDADTGELNLKIERR